MTENICTSVVCEPPDYSSEQVLDTLVLALTGQSLADFAQDVRQNLGGKYDDLYKEDDNAD